VSGKATTGVFLVDKTVTQTGSSILAAAENPTRSALVIQNIGSNGCSIVFAPAGGTATASAGGSGCVYLAANTFWIGPVGAVPCNAVYTIGTASDKLVVYESQNL
jgi:hypothetical protein